MLQHICGRAQSLLFTVALTCISRSLLALDLLLGRVKRNAAVTPPIGLVSRMTIPSGSNFLDAVLVTPGSRPVLAVVLICHGIGEVVDHWSGVQQLLAENGVASLVFDYSGYGRSSGCISAFQCEEDAVAAFLHLQALFPGEPVSLLGFSLGSGIGAAILSQVRVHRLVLCAAFTSFRSAARSLGIPTRLAFAVPPIWPTEVVLRTCSLPVLIVHGEQDRLFPVQMALALRAACASGSELVVLPKLSHDEPFRRPQRSYWSLVTAYLSSTEKTGV